MLGRARFVAGVVAPLLALSACSETVNGSGGPKTTGSASVATSGPATPPTDIASLGALIVTGNNSIKSAHFELRGSAAGTAVSGTGNERLSHGKVVAMELAEMVLGTRVRLIIVGTRMYAKLPKTVYSSPKPWVLLTASTQNVQLRQLYTSVRSATQAAAGDAVLTFVLAAKNLRFKGIERFDGAAVWHYSLEVVVSSLPASLPGKSALQQSGLLAIPLDLYVDSRGRTRKVTEDLSVVGQRVLVRITLTKIDVPVSVSVPPASQVQVA